MNGAVEAEKTSPSIGSFMQEHAEFVWLAILFMALRVPLVLYFRPGGYIRDWTDFVTYLGVAGLSDQGLYPSVHFWLEYPPLFPWLFIGLYRLSLLIPPWPEDPRLWFNALLGLTLAAFDLGNLILIYAIARELQANPLSSNCRSQPAGQAREWPLCVAAIYALLFTPIYVATGYYDTLPVFCMLLGLYLLIRQQAAGSGIALGVGFALKITPVILAPVAVRTLSTIRQRVVHLATLVATVAALSLPFLVTDASLYLMPFRSAIGRSSWETPWALAEGYYSYGAVAGDRFDRTVTDFATHPSTLPWLPIALAFTACYVAIWMQRLDYSDRRKMVALSTFTVCLFLLYSKGYSPQFLLYLLPLILLVCSSGHAIIYSIGLSLFNFLEHPIYYVMLPNAHWLLTGIIIARTVFIMAVMIEALLVLFSAPTALRRRWQQVVLALTVGMSAWLLVTSVGMAREYYAVRLRSEALRPVISYLQEQAQAGERRAILLTDQDAYRRLYPYLYRDYTFRMVKTDRIEWEQTIAAWAKTHQSFWFWRSKNTDPDLEAWLAQNVRAVMSQAFEPGTLYLLTMKESTASP